MYDAFRPLLVLLAFSVEFFPSMARTAGSLIFYRGSQELYVRLTCAVSWPIEETYFVGGFSWGISSVPAFSFTSGDASDAALYCSRKAEMEKKKSVPRKHY